MRRPDHPHAPVGPPETAEPCLLDCATCAALRARFAHRLSSPRSAPRRESGCVRLCGCLASMPLPPL